MRAWDVLDARVLATLRAVRREQFVPTGQEYLAFADTVVALPCGQQMLRPSVVGRLLQARSSSRAPIVSSKSAPALGISLHASLLPPRR